MKEQKRSLEISDGDDHDGRCLGILSDNST